MGLLIFAVVATTLVLCALLIYRVAQKYRQQLNQWEQVQLERDRARCLAIEEGMMDWLAMLKLPQLEEETQLREAARRLRIVLVEQLMRGPRIR